MADSCYGETETQGKIVGSFSHKQTEVENPSQLKLGVHPIILDHSHALQVFDMRTLWRSFQEKEKAVHGVLNIEEFPDDPASEMSNRRIVTEKKSKSWEWMEISMICVLVVICIAVLYCVIRYCQSKMIEKVRNSIKNMFTRA